MDALPPNKVTQRGSKQGVGAGNPGNKRNGMFMPDGRSVWAGFYSNWKQLSNKDRQTIIDSRITNKSRVKEIKNQVADPIRTFASLKSTSSKDANSTSDKTDDDEAPDHGCDAFRGRQNKKAKKNQVVVPVSLFAYILVLIATNLIGWCRCNASTCT